MTLEELIQVREAARTEYQASLKHTTIVGDTKVEDAAWEKYVTAVVAVKKFSA